MSRSTSSYAAIKKATAQTESSLQKNNIVFEKQLKAGNLDFNESIKLIKTMLENVDEIFRLKNLNDRNSSMDAIKRNQVTTIKNIIQDFSGNALQQEAGLIKLIDAFKKQDGEAALFNDAATKPLLTCIKKFPYEMLISYNKKDCLLELQKVLKPFSGLFKKEEMRAFIQEKDINSITNPKEIFDLFEMVHSELKSLKNNEKMYYSSVIEISFEKAQQIREPLKHIEEKQTNSHDQDTQKLASNNEKIANNKVIMPQDRLDENDNIAASPGSLGDKEMRWLNPEDLIDEEVPKIKSSGPNSKR